MSFFKSRKRNPPVPPPPPPQPSQPDAGAIPVAQIDLSKRYDLYFHSHGEDRLYENVKILGIRTFESKKPSYGLSSIGGFLEVEASNGGRMMIPHLRLQMICEHGSKPAYTVLRVQRNIPE